jgi:transcriptional regulator with XRE-family HTH domain
MHLGRKILNLRADRGISQQELARACNITPSALSKIEAGINSPRTNVIWKLARNLGVSVEYLVDEEIPYPYPAHSYRKRLVESGEDPEMVVDTTVTLEEAEFLEVLRKGNRVVRELAFLLPDLTEEALRLVHFIVHHSRIERPSPEFWEAFQKLVTSNSERGPSRERLTPTGQPLSQNPLGSIRRGGKKTRRPAEPAAAAPAAKPVSKSKPPAGRGKAPAAAAGKPVAARRIGKKR